MLIALFVVIALSVTTLGVLGWQVVGARLHPVRRGLEEVRTLGAVESEAVVDRRRRRQRREQMEGLLEELGKAVPARFSRRGSSAMLQHAGYMSPTAPAIFWGVRLLLVIVMCGLTFITLPLAGSRPAFMALAILYSAGVGMVVPWVLVHRRARLRQHELQLALPDAVDMLVICVEAGLALNQALQRVAQEARTFSPGLQRQLNLVNLEMQAGIPREQALRNLGERTGVADIGSLVTMLVQADRFGTSIAQSLRVHSETLRQKRRQRAEEAAAKTTIKLVFPLVFCIFPALFVVVLGGGVIQIMNALRGM